MYSKVYFEITNICNKSCSFCPGTVRPKRLVSYEEFELVTDKLHGVTEYLYYHLMGEPTLHPELTRFIKRAAEKGYKSIITTNGSILPKVGDELIASGVYKVNISVHSFEDGTREDYESYINGCLDFAEKASDAGIIVIFRLWNSGYDEGRNNSTVDMIKDRFGGEWKHSVRGARIRPKLHLEYGDRFAWPDTEAEDGGDHVFCYGLKDHFAILSDGRIVPCCLDREGTITLGNIFTDDIDDVLSSERTKAIKKGFSEHRAVEELCRKCGYARRFK